MKKRQRRIRKPEHPFRLVAFALVVLACLGLAGYIYAHTDRTPRVSRLVTFHERGEERVILTYAKTVRDALNDANIKVSLGDVVEPSIDSELLSTDFAIIVYRARQVLVVDGVQKQKIMTAAQSPNEIVTAARLPKLSNKDKTTFRVGDFVKDGASTVLTIKRSGFTPSRVAFKPRPDALTRSKGAQIFVDSHGVAHRETYYDLPMNIVINHCGAGNKYTVRAADGAKVDKDGYVLVAANYGVYPRCSIVETSLGPGKVYDTGGFALRHPHGFDLATDWSRADGI